MVRFGRRARKPLAHAQILQNMMVIFRGRKMKNSEIAVKARFDSRCEFSEENDAHSWIQREK